VPGPNSPKLSAKASANLPWREGGDRVPQLLDLAKAEFVVADACQKHLDPRISGRGLDPVEHIAQCRFRTDQKPQQAVSVRTLGKALGEVNTQNDAVGERGYFRL